MRKLHPSYESFVKEQTPKYGQTFLEWYAENYKIGEVEFLKELNKKNKYLILSPEGFGYDEKYISYFKDFFTKKLQLCQNLIGIMVNGSATYELNIVADIMDLYEDVIQEICIRDNVYVTYLPAGHYRDNPFLTDFFKFDNLEDLIEELSSGIIIVYHFLIHQDSSISVRYYKREPLTRTVLFEKENQL